MTLYWLGDPPCHDPLLTGGKAANLSRLAARHRVPPGFCIPFDHPPDEGLAEAYHALGERCGTSEPIVAVRSSAIDEDGNQTSFAGQHETYLNLRGAAAVTAAVHACRASAGSHRAREYRESFGLGADQARVAVLVQQLVPADASAVVFSVHPISGPGEVLVNATWGLGESLVGGSVNPDSYVFRTSDLHLLSRQTGLKERMTVPVPGGTREVLVPGALRRLPSLTAEQAAEAARLAVRLEAEMGWPADIELAFAGADLYLLQCRPITALSPRDIDEGGDRDESADPQAG